jgi:hypothetical protein
VRQNPPLRLLEQECHKNCLFSLTLAETLPRVEVVGAKCEKAGERDYSFACAVKNVGYLPSSAPGRHRS